jgi:hypothetical protein
MVRALCVRSRNENEGIYGLFRERVRGGGVVRAVCVYVCVTGIVAFMK